MNIYQDYYESKLALEILTKEIEYKKSVIVQALLLEPGNKIAIPGAKFHIKKDFVYEFSEETQLLQGEAFQIVEKIKEQIKENEKRIKTLKAQEIEDGTAKLIETKMTPVMTMDKLKGGE